MHSATVKRIGDQVCDAQLYKRYESLPAGEIKAPDASLLRGRENRLRDPKLNRDCIFDEFHPGPSPKINGVGHARHRLFPNRPALNRSNPNNKAEISREKEGGFSKQRFVVQGKTC